MTLFSSYRAMRDDIAKIIEQGKDNADIEDEIAGAILALPEMKEMLLDKEMVENGICVMVRSDILKILQKKAERWDLMAGYNCPTCKREWKPETNEGKADVGLSDLLPCPFCGKKAEFVMGFNIIACNDPECPAWVWHPDSESEYKTREIAIRRWNTRAR